MASDAVRGALEALVDAVNNLWSRTDELAALIETKHGEAMASSEAIAAKIEEIKRVSKVSP